MPGMLTIDKDSAQIIHPRASPRPVPPEVPDDLAQDFREACLVLADSQKASAALSRRILQHLLRQKANIKEDDLAKEIGQVLASNQLPSHLAGELDSIRALGNIAAHPIKNKVTGQVLDVEPHEAEALLNVLEGLFDFYFVQPAKSKARQTVLNAKLQSAGKPPVK